MNPIDWNLAAQDLGRFFTEPVSGGLPFLSMGFWLIFMLFLAVYALLKKSTKTGMMLWVLAFSLFFFYKANGWLMLLLPATAAANWFLVEQMRKADEKWKKLFLSATVIIDLSALLYFKYTGFILHDVIRSNFEIGDIALPIGISFYTFQAISYA
ncbi:MAG: MBOAT family protein, partial [Bacteroidales bacterium]|nr:MBOAT family protein [Bacteroidales bacterium]